MKIAVIILIAIVLIAAVYYFAFRKVYSESDTKLVKDLTTFLVNATNDIKNNPTSIRNVYGTYKGYYITSNASIPTTMPPEMSIVLQPTKMDTLAMCVTSAYDNSATMFTWDSQNKLCTLYSMSSGNGLSLSSLPKGTLIVGSLNSDGLTSTTVPTTSSTATPTTAPTTSSTAAPTTVPTSSSTAAPTSKITIAPK